MKEFTSEFVSNDELRINNCGSQPIRERDYHTVRNRKDYSLLFVSSGRATVYCDGTEKAVTQGEAMLFLPGADQNYYFHASENCVNKWIHFTGKIFDVLNGKPVRIIKISSLHEFESNLDRLIRAFCSAGKNSELLCNGYMRAILALLLESEDLQHNKTVIENRLYYVLSYINIHFDENIDYNHCADMCYLSRDRFNHVFKEHVGYSPSRYQKHIRIERAKQLLCDLGMTVNECAETLGFDDTNYFCRVFRQETGYSPKEYKNINR